MKEENQVLRMQIIELSDLVKERFGIRDVKRMEVPPAIGSTKMTEQAVKNASDSYDSETLHSVSSIDDSRCSPLMIS